MWMRDGQVELFGPREEVLQKLRAAAAASRVAPDPAQKPSSIMSEVGETSRREAGAP
jgi:hypothetical protein